MSAPRRARRASLALLAPLLAGCADLAPRAARTAAAPPPDETGASLADLGPIVIRGPHRAPALGREDSDLGDDFAWTLTFAEARASLPKCKVEVDENELTLIEKNHVRGSLRKETRYAFSTIPPRLLESVTVFLDSERFRRDPGLEERIDATLRERLGRPELVTGDTNLDVRVLGFAGDRSRASFTRLVVPGEDTPTFTIHYAIDR